MTRPAASTTPTERPELVAFRRVASIAWMCAGWQSRSASSPGSVWYQTIETLPASPAITHGHTTRVFVALTIVAGADHVLPQSFENDICTEFGAGVCAPLHPPVVPACRWSGVHTE